MIRTKHTKGDASMTIVQLIALIIIHKNMTTLAVIPPHNTELLKAFLYGRVCFIIIA